MGSFITLHKHKRREVWGGFGWKAVFEVCPSIGRGKIGQMFPPTQRVSSFSHDYAPGLTSYLGPTTFI